MSTAREGAEAILGALLAAGVEIRPTTAASVHHFIQSLKDGRPATLVLSAPPRKSGASDKPVVNGHFTTGHQIQITTTFG